MIHELRTYTLPPGAQAKYLQLSGDVGRKIRGDKYGKQEGFWFTELGTRNQLVHLWAFPDPNERERRRGLLAKDEAWNTEYIPQIRPLLLAQENKIMSPVLPLNPPPDPGWVYELRWYRTHVGRAKEWLDPLKAGMPPREKHMHRGGPLQTENAQLNQDGHRWAFPHPKDPPETRPAPRQETGSQG